MEFTGERVVPGQVDADLWQEHVSRYEFARTRVRAGSRVLDAGCGTGYGAARLAAAGASEVLGVDLAADAIAWAAEHFQAPNLRFQQGDITQWKDSGGYDLVVAFEVIEHLPDAEAFLREVQGLLIPGGALLVSTPNRRYYTEERGFHNPFHAKEYDGEEFRALLGKYFAHCLLLEQNHVPAISFLPTEAGAGTTAFASGAVKSSQPHFFLAICSSQPVEAQPFVYLPESGNVLRERELHIHKLEADLAAFQEQTKRELTERQTWASQLEAQLHEKGEFIVRIQKELEERREWATRVDAELKEKGDYITRMQLEAEERLAWAADLEQRIADRDALVLERQQAAEKLEAEVLERTGWATKLDEEIGVARVQLQETQADLDRREQARAMQVAELEQELARRAQWAHGLNDEISTLRFNLQETERKLETAQADLRLIFESRWYRYGLKLRISPVPEADRHMDRPGSAT